MDRRSGKRVRTERFEEDALREILTIERQAQGIISDAEAEAQRIVITAQQRVRELKAKAEAEAEGHAEAALGQATSEMEQEARAIQEQAEQDVRLWLREAEKHYGEALAYILDVITLNELR